MPGMLSQGQQPSSGPVASTPPATTPGAGDPPGSGTPGPGQPQDLKALTDQATQLVYGERFDQLIEMFQTNGPDKFARSMAVAVNTAISEIEKTNGPIGHEAAAEVGADLFTKLLEDMLVKPKDGMAAVVEGVTAEQLQEVMPAILVMYADSHSDVAKEDVQGVMQEIDKGVRAQGPGPGGNPENAEMMNTPGAPAPGGPV